MARRRGKNANKQDDPLLLLDSSTGQPQSRGLHDYVLPGAVFLLLLLGGSALGWFCSQQQQAIEDLTEALTTVQSRVTRLQQQLGSGNAQLAGVGGFEERLLALEESYAKAQRQAEVALAASEQIKSKDLQTKVWALQTEMNTKLAKLQQNSVSVTTLNAVLKNKSEEFEALRQSISSILSANSKVAVSISGVSKSLSVTEDRLGEHITLVDTLMSQLEDQKKEISEMKESFTNNQESLATNTQELLGVKELLEQVQRTQADEEHLKSLHRSREDPQTTTETLHSHLTAQLEAAPAQEEEEQEGTPDEKQAVKEESKQSKEHEDLEEGDAEEQSISEEEEVVEEQEARKEEDAKDHGGLEEEANTEEQEVKDEDFSDKQVIDKEETTEEQGAKEKADMTEEHGVREDNEMIEERGANGKDLSDKQVTEEEMSEEAGERDNQVKEKEETIEEQGVKGEVDMTEELRVPEDKEMEQEAKDEENHSEEHGEQEIEEPEAREKEELPEEQEEQEVTTEKVLTEEHGDSVEEEEDDINIPEEVKIIQKQIKEHKAKKKQTHSDKSKTTTNQTDLTHQAQTETETQIEETAADQVQIPLKDSTEELSTDRDVKEDKDKTGEGSVVESQTFLKDMPTDGTETEENEPEEQESETNTSDEKEGRVVGPSENNKKRDRSQHKTEHQEGEELPQESAVE
ncbi:DNA ligase 1 [Hoplias malabaricus]|uniref:DNA ligase 1 n=1 Tax=Hoplias malabaricus TaxID=27720 RepID=UPI003461D3AB